MRVETTSSLSTQRGRLSEYLFSNVTSAGTKDALLQHRIDSQVRGSTRSLNDEQRRVMTRVGRYLHKGEMTSMNPRRNYDERTE